MEVIIVRIGEASGHTLKAHQKCTLMSDIEELLGAYMVKGADGWFNINNATLRLFWKHKKSVIVLFEDKLLDLTSYNPNGNPNITREQADAKGLWSTECLYDPWPDTSSMTAMCKTVDNSWREAQPNGPQANKLYVAQLLLNPFSSNSPSISSLLTVIDLTRTLQRDQDVPKWFADHKTGRVNIILLDFVFGCDPGSECEFVKAVINSNMDVKPITITDALATVGRETLSNGTLTLDFHNNDSSLSSQVKQRLINTFFTVYPQLVEEFNKNAPDQVNLTIQPTLCDNPSKTEGMNITLSGPHFHQHPEDTDILTCEAMCVAQNYSNMNQPIWLIEGVINYARYRYGTNNRAAGWILPDYSSEQHYTKGCRIVTRFLVWIKSRINPSIIKELNSSLIAKTYTEQTWMQQTGRTVDQLWKQYARDSNLYLSRDIVLNIPLLVSGGTYKLINVNSAKALDVFGCGKLDRTNVQICDDCGNVAQRWTLCRHNDCTYKLVNPNSRMALDVAGRADCRADGSNVQIYTDNGTAAQRWLIVLNSNDGSYIRVNILEGRVLDVHLGETANGANVQIWPDNGTAAQKWRLISL